VSDYPTQRLPIQPGADGRSYGGLFEDPPGTGRPRRTRRRRRGPMVFLVVLVVLLGLLVVADRVAVAYADNQFATQIQKQGFSSKPHVTIEGFPFLTQLAGRRFNDVQITANNEQAGPVTIDNITAAMRGIQLNSNYNSGTVSSIDGTGLITFASLAHASPVPIAKITMINSTEARLTVNLVVFTGSAVAQVTKVGTNKINIRVVSAGGIPASALGGLSNFTITIPQLPMGLTLQSVSVTAQGILVHITGQNVAFGG
jgi:ABC-type lipoprotein release transport system permease subunit